MTSNRIQKLLFSEYSDFEDIVLVEGPFAETDRQGKGIRQVQIGLTPTKLILASYFVESVAVEELGDQWRPRKGQDPDIESFELVSAYPVESVNLSVYRNRRRQTLKARFCNGKVVYYEIGGWQERKMLWSVWCERIKFLSPYESRTSLSETSVGTSSSGSSSLYIARSSLSVNQTGKPTLWCHYACTEGSWVDPHLYLGPKFYEKGINNITIQDVDMMKYPSPVRKAIKKKQRRHYLKEPLMLSTEHEVMAAEALQLWETGSAPGRVRKVRRRYAFNPSPYLLGGMALFRFSKPLAYSVQTKKNMSMVDLREDSEEFRPPMLKGCLLRTMSHETLAFPPPSQEILGHQSNIYPQHSSLEFWMRHPEDLLQWGHAQCKAQQRYLRANRKRTDPHVFRIREKKKSNKEHHRCKTGKKSTIRGKTYPVGDCLHGGSGDSVVTRHLYSSIKDQEEEGWLLPVSMFRSSNLSHQLTMLHQQLFLQITTLDLSRARVDMSSWRAPSLRTLVLFSYRISCVVVNQILLEHKVQKRAYVIVKFVSVAYKCHKLQSQMSAEAVLWGLHSPPVYRLQRTWAYVRKHHATNYRRFEDLSRRYFDCREPLFQKTYDNMVRVPPFLPSVSLLVAVLLQSLSDLPQVQSFRFTSECSESCHKTRDSVENNSSERIVPLTTSLRRILSSLQLHSSLPSPSSSREITTCQSDSHLHSASRETLLENLDRFFAPVSDTPARRVLQDLEYFLESHKAAATRYHIPINPRVRGFLLHSRHPDMRALFRQSLLIEP